MHLFINGLAATAGGGLTYLRNIIPRIAGIPSLMVTAVVRPALRKEFDGFPNVTCLESDAGGVRRFWYEQSEIPSLIQKAGADVLLSTGNFALRKSPVPQILLSRNSLYTSADFFRDLRSRGEFRFWLDTHLRAILARKSVQWADITVAPSEAFAAELRRWTGAEVRSIHHGFDQQAFSRDPGGLSPHVEQKLSRNKNTVKMLFVSHYNYYRNFETLFRSLPFLRQRFPNSSIQLLLTCELQPGKNPGAYRTEGAAKLLRDLGVSDMVVELGAIPYQQLHHLYSRADIYVSPAYAETFAHPLVEAMSSGLPVVASNLPVHREICGEAALYFERFDAEVLAETVMRVLQSRDKRDEMAALGRELSRKFSWAVHVEQILQVSESLIHNKDRKLSAA